jgi:hypothetical protein
MAHQVWAVKRTDRGPDKISADVKVYYKMELNGAGTIGKAQCVKARGEDDEMGVLLDR